MEARERRRWNPEPSYPPERDAGLVLSCDCGFDVVSTEVDELILRGQEHARSAHRMELPAELIAGLVRHRGER